MKVKAISKEGNLLAAVATDTAWARSKFTYAPPPEGIYLLDDEATLTLAEGPERCGYGEMILVDSDVIRGSRRGDYRRGTLVPTAKGQWSNYGAPHGTCASVVITWEFVPDREG